MQRRCKRYRQWGSVFFSNRVCCTTEKHKGKPQMFSVFDPTRSGLPRGGQSQYDIAVGKVPPRFPASVSGTQTPWMKLLRAVWVRVGWVDAGAGRPRPFKTQLIKKKLDYHNSLEKTYRCWQGAVALPLECFRSRRHPG